MNPPAKTDKAKNQAVKVFVRIRPFTKEETARGQRTIVKNVAHKDLTLALLPGASVKSFRFDEIFDANTQQAEVYHVVVSPLIKQILLGYNCTVFAYGQTGSGKTHTITGPNFTYSDSYEKEQTGLIPRAIDELFGELAVINDQCARLVMVSYMEIYNEEIRDLLSPYQQPLKIYDDPENKGSVHVRGLSEKVVSGAEEALKLLNTGLIQRHTSATNLNRESSRSHAIYTILVHTRETSVVGGEDVFKMGKLHLVDLAGNESIGRSGATGMRATEAGKINQSLLTLGKVIKNLADKCPHVPYRESKLTRFLQDSLGGKTKTCMIATVSPAHEALEETLCTLDYATSARNVCNFPRINENRKRNGEIRQLRDETEALKRELDELKRDLSAARTGTGIYVDCHNYEKLLEEKRDGHQELQQMRQKERELTERLRTLKDTLREKVEQAEEEAKKFEAMRQQVERLKEEYKKEKYISRHYETRESTLSATARDLANMCEATTKQADIFHNKYRVACDRNLSNADAARNIFETACRYMSETETSTKHVTNAQIARFCEMQNNVATIADLDIANRLKADWARQPINQLAAIQDSALSVLDQLETGMEPVQRSLEQLRCREVAFEQALDDTQVVFKERVAEEDAYLQRMDELYAKEMASKEQLENQLEDSQAQFFEAQRQFTEAQQEAERQFMETQQEAERQFTEAQRQFTEAQRQFKEAREESQRQFKEAQKEAQRQLTEAQRKFADSQNQHLNALKTSSELIGEMSKLREIYCNSKPVHQMHTAFNQTICNNQASFVSQIGSAVDCVNATKRAVTDALTCNTGRVAEIREQFERHSMEHDKNIKSVAEEISGKASSMLSQVQLCATEQTRHFDDLKKFSRQSVALMKREIDARVVRDIRSGDTPLRQTFQFPRTIPEPGSRTDLVRQFMEHPGELDESGDSFTLNNTSS